MKRIIAILTAALLALGVVAMLTAPAGASGGEADNWLQVNSPGSECLYSYASVDSTYSNPGGAYAIWSEAATVVRVPNPCNFALASAQSLDAGILGVRATLVCRWSDHFNDQVTETVWQSPVTYNAQGTGIVTVINGSNHNPCNPTDFIPGSIQERTVVDTYVWTGIGYAHYPTQTTHWETR